MSDRQLTTTDLGAIREHVCEPQMGAMMARMDQRFDALDSKLDRRMDESEKRIAETEARQDRAEADISSLKRVAGRALFIYGLLALGAGSMIGVVWEWAKRKLEW